MLKYLADHRSECAYHTISWSWLLAGAVVVPAGAIIGNAISGPFGSEPAFARALVHAIDPILGNPYGSLLGMAGAAGIAGLVALLAHRGSSLIRLLLVIIGLAVGAFLSWSAWHGWVGATAPQSASRIAGAAMALVLAGMLAGGRAPVSSAQEPWLMAVFLALVYLFLDDRLVFITVVVALVSSIYLLAILFRLLALAIGGRHGLNPDIVEPAEGWPVYTVLVPLYRERNVARNILHHLSLLDYPRHRLDVKFLLEADDPDTLKALETAGIPPWAEVLIVPLAQPKTKPRACNHGLAKATGEFLVIFDAEDRPDPSQLKLAVCAFAKSGSRVLCLQAQLGYHNYAQNLLTRWFAMEYNVWFRRYLCGLERLGVPIPLGGTSNHFRIQGLRELGGWDPFNVTEDCDLGMRLHLARYTTKMLESTTWEEANSRYGNWLRQRSRWLKGYMITHLVWFRRPLSLLYRLGPWGTLGFMFCVSSVAILGVLNLVLWTQMVIYGILISIDLRHGFGLWQLLSTRDTYHNRESWPIVYSGTGEDPFWTSISHVFFYTAVCLLAGNLLFILVNVIAGRRPGQKGLVLPAIFSPLYWVLISLAACKGLWQLILRPHYWEKTVHGLDGSSDGSSKE